MSKKNQDGVYKKPTRGWSERTNKIVGIIFLVFVMICFIIRGFVGGDKPDEGKDSSKQQSTTQALTTASENQEAQNLQQDEEGDNQTRTDTESDTTTLREQTYYTFRNESTLESHYEKHGNEFTYNNSQEYVDGANRVIADPNSLHKLEAEDGDDVYYLEETNEFVIVSTDGYIRTYFKPTKGKEYFDKQ